MSNRRWLDTAIEKAIAMHDNGMSWREVADAYGETFKSLYAAVERYRKRKAGYVHSKDGSPIFICRERAAYENDAIRGSARLLAEIERVFGRAA
jgi:hypothetical protein